MIVDILVGILVGLVSALLFFEGLWWTVRRMPASPRPTVLMAASFVVRVLLFLAVALALATWSAVALIAAMPGFLVGRRIATARHTEATP